MSDRVFNLRTNEHVPLVPKTPRTEEKGGGAPQLSFAQRVEALDQHHYDALQPYLSKPVDALSPSDQREALGSAIVRNDPLAVSAFIKCGVGVNQCDNRGLTPLLQGCGNVWVMTVLLNSGADPNLQGPKSFDFTPLLCCIERNDFGGARFLTGFKADVNQERHSDKVTPLHLAAAVLAGDANDRSHFVEFLLLSGANPLAKDLKGERPKLQLKHFRGLGPDLTEALQNGKRHQVDRWIRAVGTFLPDAKAASLLVKWAGLCNADQKLSERIHTLIKDYLEKLEGKPPADVDQYVKNYNAQYKLAKRDDIVAKLTLDGLELIGKGREFQVEGKNFSAVKHCPLLIKLARFWALHGEENRMDLVMGILIFAKKAAKDQQAPQEVRDKLFADVKALRNQLKKSSDPELAGRVKALDSFLNPFN